VSLELECVASVAPPKPEAEARREGRVGSAERNEDRRKETRGRATRRGAEATRRGAEATSAARFQRGFEKSRGVGI
jgi:hypothetical protein